MTSLTHDVPSEPSVHRPVRDPGRDPGRDEDPPRMSADAVAALRRGVRGRLLFPRDLDFGAATTGHDRSVRHRPGVVVEVADAEDAVTVVRVARDFGQPVVTQLTGHGPLARSFGGVLVSTRALRRIERQGRRVRLGAGLTSRELLTALEPQGLTLPLGSAGGVGVVGYLLGGGVGPLGRAYGFGSDAVAALEVVTGEGHLRRVEADRHPDLFWALRGGKTGLGLVTAVEVEARPAPRLLTHQMVYGGEVAAELLMTAARVAETLPDSVTLSVGLATVPGEPGRPGADPQRVAVLQVCEVGPGAGRTGRAVAAFDHLGAVATSSGTGGLSEHLQAYGDDGPPTATRRACVLLNHLDGGTVEALVAAVDRHPETAPLLQLRRLGGALAAPTSSVTPDAVGGRAATWLLVVVLAGPAASHPDAEAALDDVLASVGPAVPGPGRASGQANFADGFGPHGLERCWDHEVARDLAAVRRRHDPDELFATRTSRVPQRELG